MTKDNQVSLDKLMQTIHDNQSKGIALPSDKVKNIYADPEGNIVTLTGSDPIDGQISAIPQDTFYANRLDQDRSEVKNFLPRNTEEVRMSDGIIVFIYSIKSKYEYAHNHKSFEFGLYYDGANYQVKLIAPELESYWASPHTGHLYSDGRLCLSKNYGGGQPSLKEAYSKSVLWALGIEVALTGKHQFPFTIDQ